MPATLFGTERTFLVLAHPCVSPPICVLSYHFSRARATSFLVHDFPCVFCILQQSRLQLGLRSKRFLQELNELGYAPRGP